MDLCYACLNTLIAKYLDLIGIYNRKKCIISIHLLLRVIKDMPFIIINVLYFSFVMQ